MKKPVGIHIADTHLAENTLEINRKIFSQVAQLAEDMGITSIFHNGDIFTSRKGQSQSVLVTFRKILNEELAPKGIMMYAIPGNHDKSDGTSDESMCDVFDGVPAFTALGAGSVMSYKNIDIIFLPYYDEALMYSQKLDEISLLVNKDKTTILITHVGIDGVKTNSGIAMSSEVTQELFEKFTYVLVGHYHDRQVTGSRDHIIYTGSTHQANFGEDDKKGVVVIYDDATDPIEFIDLDFPKYVTVDVLPQDITKELLTLVTEKQTEAKVRIRINGEVTDEQKSLIVQMKDVGAKVIVEKQEFTPIDIVSSQDVTISANDVLESFDTWAKEKKIEGAWGRKVLQNVL